jgi:hypothetical protein
MGFAGNRKARVSHNSSRLVLFAIYATLQLSCLGQTDPAEIIKRAAKANERDFQASPQFDCTVREVSKKDGTTTDKTFDIRMIDGTPYRRLIAVNGKPLSAAAQNEERQKESRERERRSHESPSERKRRVSEYQKELNHDHLLMTEMTRAFTFTLAGEEQWNGHPVYVLDAIPRRDYKPPVRDARVLTGMKGRMWIEKTGYHWAKVEAEVMRPVTFGYFIAKVEPGTHFVLEQSPVSPQIWQPQRFGMSVASKVLWKQRNSQSEETYTNYGRAEQKR